MQAEPSIVRRLKSVLSGVQRTSSWLLITCVLIPRSAASKPKELNITPISIEVNGTWTHLCVYNWPGTFWWETWCVLFLFYFILWGKGVREGAQAFLFLFVCTFGVMICFCSGTLCSKCLQTWTLWLYSSFLPVTAGGTAYQDTRPHGLPCPSHEGTRSCNFFCLGFILGLDESLFVWK